MNCGWRRSLLLKVLLQVEVTHRFFLPHPRKFRIQNDAQVLRLPSVYVGETHRPFTVFSSGVTPTPFRLIV